MKWEIDYNSSPIFISHYAATRTRQPHHHPTPGRRQLFLNVKENFQCPFSHFHFSNFSFQYTQTRISSTQINYSSPNRSIDRVSSSQIRDPNFGYLGVYLQLLRISASLLSKFIYVIPFAFRSSAEAVELLVRGKFDRNYSWIWQSYPGASKRTQS